MSALVQSGRLAEAQLLGRQLCAATPGDASLWMLLASAQAASGALEDVVLSCDRIIALQPQDASAHSNRGVALYSLRRLAQAEQAFRTALSITPSLLSAGNNLGMILKELGRSAEAIHVFERLLSNNSAAAPAQRATLYANLAFAQLDCDQFERAELTCRMALQLDPGCAPASNNLAQALKGLGRLKESVDQQRAAVALDLANATLHSNLLLDLNYLADLDAGECAREHRLWGERHVRIGEQPTVYPNIRDHDRRLRVGYVSPDFRAHSVAFFIEPLLRAHDRTQIEVYGYANVLQPDPVTQKLRGLVNQWRNIWGMDDARVAALIRNDAIDILVDLAGHTRGNRLGVFGRKPAPVQVTWLGYPNTTGLREVEYRITDSLADPPGTGDALYTESLIRMPGGFLCYQPLPDCPAVADLPSDRSGAVTFGCFNNSAKVNDKVLDVWCQILTAMPDARLLLKSRSLGGANLQKRYLEEFARRGISPGRIELLGRITSTQDHLALYGRVDIALDTFPYNGTTTTCEALWMGVPVVTLAGDRHAGRVGISLLSRIGLGNLIAANTREYVSLAMDLACDSDKCRTLRATLRERLSTSPLCDGLGFARAIETVYRQVWRSWCENGHAQG
jgi:predicted O-linked N-acetylglucosamine transferase (SPINDLY family)